MTTLTAMPFVKSQWFTNTGLVAAGYQLFTYAAGTSTKQATYTDATSGTPNANPIVLDSAGRADVFLSASSYKFVLAPPTDTDPPTSPVWTEDNILATPTSNQNTDVTGTFGANVTVGQPVYLSDGSGGKNAGQWYLADATNTYSSTIAPAVGFALGTVLTGATGTVRIAGEITRLSGLSAGSTYYISGTPGAITTSAPANARKILVADSTTSGIIVYDPNYFISPITDVQTFTTPGANNWTMPSNALWIDVICYGGGGGGAGGQTVGGAGAASAGGPGGGGGVRVQRRLQPSEVTSPVSVTVGVGGPGGTGGSGVGTVGGSTSFGAYVIAFGGGPATNTGVASATGGGCGAGSAQAGVTGSTTNSTGGGPGGQNGGASVNPPVPGSEHGGGGTAPTGPGSGAIYGGGGGGGNNATGAVGQAGGNTMFGGAGAGCGGGVTAANANTAGGNGGGVNPVGTLSGSSVGGGPTGGLAGAAFIAGQNGAVGGSAFGAQGGAGGGGRRDGTTAAAGGAGGLPSGGGGGGGAGQNGSAGGAGGIGGGGACYVITGLGRVSK